MCNYIINNFPEANTSGPTQRLRSKPPPQTPSPRHASTFPLFQSFRGCWSMYHTKCWYDRFHMTSSSFTETSHDMGRNAITERFLNNSDDNKACKQTVAVIQLLEGWHQGICHEGLTSRNKSRKTKEKEANGHYSEQRLQTHTTQQMLLS